MNLIKKMSCYRSLRVFFQGWISSSLLPIMILLLLIMFAVHFLASLWFVAGDTVDGWATSPEISSSNHPSILYHHRFI